MTKLKIELDGDLLQYFINEYRLGDLDKLDIKDGIIDAIKNQIILEETEFSKSLFFGDDFNPSDYPSTRRAFKEYNEHLVAQKEKYPTILKNVDLIKVSV